MRAILILVLASGLLWAQPAPSYQPESIATAPLLPGDSLSILGRNLGPAVGCAPQPGSSHPTSLCQVQVLFNGALVQLQYAQERRIDIKIPDDAPTSGTATLRVVYRGRSGPTATLSFGPTVELDGPAHVGGPIWLRVHSPVGYEVRYPGKIEPTNFDCEQVEVRYYGTLLPPTKLRPNGLDGSGSGSLCSGNWNMGGNAAPRIGRLPLHLAFHFEQPGAYEVRYARLTKPPRRYKDAKTLFQTEWTPIEILPAETSRPAKPPSDPQLLLTDYLPNIFGVPDERHLALIEPYLYHSEGVIRRYAAGGLLYWPENRIKRFAVDVMRRRGPNELFLGQMGQSARALDALVPYLRSNNTVVLSGAIQGVAQMLPATTPAELRQRAADAFLAASDHVLQIGDGDAVSRYISKLTMLDGNKARPLLWSFVDRGLQTGGALETITRFKNPEDLPRIQAFLQSPTADAPGNDCGFVMLYLRELYGEAAIPVLEAVLQKSTLETMQRRSAEQLALAGRKSGFAYLRRLVEGKTSSAPGTLRFMKENFPALRNASDQQILAYLKSR